MMNVRINDGERGNSGFHYVKNEGGEQIATYANNGVGFRMVATFKNGRTYNCSKTYKSITAMAKAYDWNIIED